MVTVFSLASLECVSTHHKEWRILVPRRADFVGPHVSTRPRIVGTLSIMATVAEAKRYVIDVARDAIFAVLFDDDLLM